MLCDRPEPCPAHEIWTGLQARMEEYLSSISLKQICEKNGKEYLTALDAAQDFSIQPRAAHRAARNAAHRAARTASSIALKISPSVPSSYARSKVEYLDRRRRTLRAGSMHMSVDMPSSNGEKG